MKHLNISPESVHVVLSSTKHTSTHKIQHLIASTYLIDRELLIPYETLIKNIKILGLKKLMIFHILDLEQDSINQQHKGFVSEFLEIDYISTDTFVHLIMSVDFNFSVINKHCLYICHQMSWSGVIRKFKRDIDVTISGGSNVKRHLLSPLDVRLSSYLIAIFNLNCLEVINHNNFNALDKNIYLPYADMSNKSKIIVTKKGVKTIIPIDDNTCTDVSLVPQHKHINNQNPVITTKFYKRENSGGGISREKHFIAV